jgi:hypothetical protein
MMIKMWHFCDIFWSHKMVIEMWSHRKYHWSKAKAFFNKSSVHKITARKFVVWWKANVNYILNNNTDAFEIRHDISSRWPIVLIFWYVCSTWYWTKTAYSVFEIITLSFFYGSWSVQRKIQENELENKKTWLKSLFFNWFWIVLPFWKP